MTDKPPLTRVEKAPINPFRRFADMETVESELRICSAVGDDERAHLRPWDKTRTLCSRPVAIVDGEEAELKKAGGKRGCPGCHKRAGPLAHGALARANQTIGRTIKERK